MTHRQTLYVTYYLNKQMSQKLMKFNFIYRVGLELQRAPLSFVLHFVRVGGNQGNMNSLHTNTTQWLVPESLLRDPHPLYVAVV